MSNTCQTCTHWTIDHNPKPWCNALSRKEYMVKPSKISHCDKWTPKVKHETNA